MKVICAWCGSPISVNCDHCGAPMLPTNTVGGTFFMGDAMVCLSGSTAVIYYRDTVDKMETSHGMCGVCKSLTWEERDMMIAARRKAGVEIPTEEALDRIAEERETATAHEVSARAYRRAGQPPHMLLQIQIQQPPKKRGPKGVSTEPTDASKDDAKKDGDADK